MRDAGGDYVAKILMPPRDGLTLIEVVRIEQPAALPLSPGDRLLVPSDELQTAPASQTEPGRREPKRKMSKKARRRERRAASGAALPRRPAPGPSAQRR